MRSIISAGFLPHYNIPVRGSISVGRCDARAKSPLGGFIIRDRVQPLRGCGKIRGRQYLQICDPYRSRGGIRCRRFPQICPPDGFQSITNAIVGRPLGLRAENACYLSSFSSSSLPRYHAVRNAVHGTRPPRVRINIMLPPGQCMILNNNAKLNRLMLSAPNLKILFFIS